MTVVPRVSEIGGNKLEAASVNRTLDVTHQVRVGRTRN